MQIIPSRSMAKKNNDIKNPWSPQDEGDHYPIMREWWTIETLFKTLEDNRKWNLMIIMSYNMEKPSCFFQYVLFDITSKKCIIRKDIDDKIEKLTHKKNKIDLQYGKTSIKGLFPSYDIHIEDKDQDFTADMKYKADSLPHWIAQGITNGKIPFGLNYYKYGYIPNCDLNGIINLKDKSYTIKGKGYLEHVWGEWSYQKSFQKVSQLNKTITTYINLAKWWISQHKPCIPKRLAFTTENNIFGYDWCWGIFDNNWSLFYGNIMFWLSEGPVFGVLSITPDGKNYWDFCNIKFHYNKLAYIKDYDIYFPSDFELTGKLDDKKIHVRFWLTTKNYDYIDPFENNGFYKAFILSEMPGQMEGDYTDNEKIVKLKGDCKMMPLRQPSALGHNSLQLEFIKPPKGVGIDIDFNSHFLKKKINAKIQFAPRPHLGFHMKKLRK